jgi:hypothetical protein
MFRNLDTGMTRDKYFAMKEQLGQEPIDSEIPPDLNDLPDIVINAISTFNRLGDKIYPEVGYTGKDYTNLSFFIKIYDLDTDDIEYFLDILNWLDGRAIKKSSEQMKKEYEKLKRKNSGK